MIGLKIAVWLVANVVGPIYEVNRCSPGPVNVWMG